MAADKKRRHDDKKDPNIVISLLIALLIGGIGGGAFGYFGMPVARKAEADASKPAVEVAKQDPSAGRFPSDALEIPLQPIIIDIDKEHPTKVRLELSVIAARGTSNTGTLQGELREDAIAFLRGLTVKDIEGARGLQNLREQLDDRAKIRGRGAVLGLLVGGIVLE
jgi:flagellar FliL protein